MTDELILSKIKSVSAIATDLAIRYATGDIHGIETTARGLCIIANEIETLACDRIVEDAALEAGEKHER